MQNILQKLCDHRWISQNLKIHHSLRERIYIIVSERRRKATKNHCKYLYVEAKGKRFFGIFFFESKSIIVFYSQIHTILSMICVWRVCSLFAQEYLFNVILVYCVYSIYYTKKHRSYIFFIGTPKAFLEIRLENDKGLLYFVVCMYYKRIHLFSNSGISIGLDCFFKLTRTKHFNRLYRNIII